VSRPRRSWDVTSLQGGQVTRYIEVKGRAGVGGVALTPNEWIKAQRFGKDYWLYVVENCKTKLAPCNSGKEEEFQFRNLS